MKYLCEAEQDVAMRVLHSNLDVAPQKHTIYTHDFAMLATHDVPCQVCFDASAIMERNLTIGKFKREFQPCRECQKKGWRLKRSFWKRLFNRS